MILITSSQQFWTQWRYYLFRKQVNECQEGSFSSVGTQMDTQWLVRIGDANFLHCRVTELEHAP